MRLLVLAVGQRQPAWVDQGFDEYARRMPRELPMELKALKAEPRGARSIVDVCLNAERARIDQALPRGARKVLLDERGNTATTRQLADRLRLWQRDGRDVAFLIGGPDGLHPALKAAADETLRLSDLTLPHGMARVLLAEALYRAWSVTAGHPYHRE
ncbi:MAG: 23S rRNA (pseudouridine(1915)-N(3))-methyltransferase RlmH [Aquabacterium sp.]